MFPLLPRGISQHFWRAVTFTIKTFLKKSDPNSLLSNKPIMFQKFGNFIKVYKLFLVVIFMYVFM